MDLEHCSKLSDCNPLNYFMWSVAERKVNEEPHNTLASLRAKISEIMATMDREVVICSFKKFMSQIEATVEASGDLMEQMCM
jgi:hypothetical protein